MPARGSPMPDHAYIQLFKKLTEVKEELAVSDAFNRSKDEQIASLFGQIRRLQSNDRGRETREVGRPRRDMEDLKRSTNETIAALKAENAALEVRANIVYESGYRAPTWPGVNCGAGPSGSTIVEDDAVVRLALGVDPFAPQARE
ncbi:hypothetical protein CF326_g7550 [Tilletia indica]|nr:hypothetical protein CF326_g7550 [Tilletia indica]